MVCVGGDLETIDEKINRSRGFYSAELCGGTHVRQTEDLVDVVIVGLRSRNQSVKEVGLVVRIRFNWYCMFVNIVPD